jgi:hypothetical protein
MFLLFYARRDGASAEARRRLGGGSEGAGTPTASVPADVMGKTRADRPEGLAPPPPQPTEGGHCRNCGHPLPRQPDPSPEVDVVVQENEEGAIDLDDLDAYIEQATSVIERQQNGEPAGSVTDAKRRLTAALAANQLLNDTDFARQVAATLDREAPTGDYSALTELERLAA